MRHAAASDLYQVLDWQLELAETRGQQVTQAEAIRLRRRLTGLTETTVSPAGREPAGSDTHRRTHLRPREVADILRVSIGTVYDLLNAGEFPHSQRWSDGPGSLWFIPTADLDHYIARQAVRP